MPKAKSKDLMGKKMPLTSKSGKPACPPGKRLDIKTGTCVAKPGKREWMEKHGDRKVAKPPKK
jgi:hypothetical protein